MFDWQLLSKKSLDKIIYKVGLDEWDSMSDDDKETWINTNLTDKEHEMYETESRRRLLNQSKMGGGKKRRITKKRKLSRKRKMTRSKRR
jgi:hypothetical protein